MGAGGAMMGGTGIAEVALPIDKRIRALRDTERAAAEHESAKGEQARQRGGEEILAWKGRRRLLPRRDGGTRKLLVGAGEAQAARR